MAEKTAVVSQPDYPKSYPINTKCDWQFSVPEVYTTATTFHQKGMLECYMNNLQLDAVTNCKDKFVRLKGDFKNESIVKEMCSKSDWDFTKAEKRARFQLITDDKNQEAAGVNFFCVGKEKLVLSFLDA